AAVDGDVILVREGQYGSLDLVGRAVSVVADVGATPKLNVETSSTQAWIRLGGLAPGETQVVRGLAIAGDWSSFFGPGVLAEAQAGGTAWIEDCTLLGGTTSLRALAGSHVVLKGSTVQGFPAGFDGILSYPPGTGIEVEGTLELIGSVARGGDGYDAL